MTVGRPHERATAALRTAFVADALAMPVHWYYNPRDILAQFPGGIQGLAPAPAHHPSSIMSLHSTAQGGRRGALPGASQREIVGDVILKGRRQHWNVPNRHYHHEMPAGSNTLNAHCARVLMRSLSAHGGHYDVDAYLQDYIDFMTADPPRHPDTYAESYHRGYFANWQAGKPPRRCGAVTHDTASMGGLVSIAPLVFAERLRGTPLVNVQHIAREHLWLTHPDASLAGVCADYVTLLDTLLFRDDNTVIGPALTQAARSAGIRDLSRLVAEAPSDLHIIGGRFSPACYIDGAWPSVLYLAFKYAQDPCAGLLANANVGGDNVHRGAVLGALLGLVDDAAARRWFAELVDASVVSSEIAALSQTGPVSSSVD